MRRSLSFLAAVIAVLVIPLAAQGPPTIAQGPPTIDEIVAKNLKAKGGADKWKSVSSVRMTGKVSLQGMDLPMLVTAKRPNLSRQEITIQDKKIVQAFDGTTPWMINPMMGSDAAQEITGPQADMMKSDADFDGALVDYKEKGHKVELVGKEKLDATDVYHLKITKKGGNVQHYYLDAESGIELKTTTEMDQGGAKQSIETELSNYQAVDGIMIPHTVKQLINGNPIVTMTVEKVEFNPTLDDALFKMPAKK